MAGKKDVEVMEQEVVQEVEKNEVAIAAFDPIDLAGMGFTQDELAELSGLNNVDSSDITIPYATLAQKDTRDSKKGDIVFPDGTIIKGFAGEIEEDIAVLNIVKVRSYFPTPFDAKHTYICRSIDGKVGIDDGVAQFPGRDCRTCEFAKYPEGGGASPCRDQRLLLCARKDGSLFHYQVSGVGMGEFKKFLSSQLMHLLPQVKKALGGEILGAIRINLGVKEVDTDNGIFASPDFQVNRARPLHDGEHIRTILTAYQSYKAFEKDNLMTAAAQSKMQMATGEAEAEGGGVNQQMF